MTDQSSDPSRMSLPELFRREAESQVQILTNGLLALERNGADRAAIDLLMRAAHSLKGAARIVNLPEIEQLAHVMEDCFIAAQKNKLRMGKSRIDRLLQGVDLISQIAALSEADTATWMTQHKLRITNLLVSMYEAADPTKLVDDALPTPTVDATPPPAAPLPPLSATSRTVSTPSHDERVLRVSARNFDRLLSLVSEARVTAHAMQPQLQALQRFKQKQQEMFAAFEQLGTAMASAGMDASLQEKLQLVRQRIQPLKEMLVERLSEFDIYERRLVMAVEETLDEVLALRMRPFRDGVQAFPRMVRDLAHALGKEVQLEIQGEDTLVDRDILASMESSLSHILRNAVDHGMEPPQQRIANGKPREGRIVLEARHSAGMLVIRVSDDGQGIDPERIRKVVAARNMASTQMAAAMSTAELLDFLLLPGFSLKETTSKVSGRGVGLDAVQETVRQLYGNLQIETAPGRGFQTCITLPLSQSLLRAVVVDIGGEPYAIPISKIERILNVPAAEVHVLENKPFFTLDDQHVGLTHVGLIQASELLELGAAQPQGEFLPTIVIGTAQQRHALIVDAIRGEQSLVVQPLDHLFGKMRDISAGSLLDDGTPVLVLDVADLLVSITRLANTGSLGRLPAASQRHAQRAKRVLVVDDSLTVREMERKLLVARGFEVDVAVDGMDGWNAVRSHHYDLVIADVDMPRMDGIELVTLIRKDERLRKLPVMIVSYKDRPEDRTRGIDAGADYYLTKGSFHDETLLEAVYDLLGEDNA